MTEQHLSDAGGPTLDPGDASGGLELVISKVLRIGVLSAVAVMFVGIVVGFVDGSLSGGASDLDALIDPDAGASHTMGAAWDSLRSGHGMGIMVVGLCILLCTPMVRVIASLVGYARTRDWYYLGFTVAVLVALGVSMVLGATH